MKQTIIYVDNLGTKQLFDTTISWWTTTTTTPPPQTPQPPPTTTTTKPAACIANALNTKYNPLIFNYKRVNINKRWNIVSKRSISWQNVCVNVLFMYARVYKTVIWDYSTDIILFFNWWLLSINCLKRKNDENSFKRNITTKCHIESVYSGVCRLWPYGGGGDLVNMGGIQIIGLRLLDAPVFLFPYFVVLNAKGKGKDGIYTDLEYVNVCLDVWPIWWFKQESVLLLTAKNTVYVCYGRPASRNVYNCFIPKCDFSRNKYTALIACFEIGNQTYKKNSKTIDNMQCVNLVSQK